MGYAKTEEDNRCITEERMNAKEMRYYFNAGYGYLLENQTGEPEYDYMSRPVRRRFVSSCTERRKAV